MNHPPQPNVEKTPEQGNAELHTRGLVLDALTSLKSAHEELLNGNPQRADVYLQKGWILIQEARTETAKLATRPPSRP